ncbi:MAG: TRAP transporter small permease [Synergistaceae bacterium]|jgi:TRAP-type C4-dicarboxylate transport system permease small subunit|nr:TRAP transporter small permease [Synergistaceae bacterium]
MKRLTEHFEEYLLIASLMFSVGIVFLQVVMRYVFLNSFFWSEELARYVFLWQIWLGASYAAKEGKHLRIEIVKGFLRGRGRIAFELGSTAVWFGFCVFLAYQGTMLTKMLFTRMQVSPAMRIPMGYAYASVPAGAALMALRLVQRMRRTVEEYRVGEYRNGEAAKT